MPILTSLTASKFLITSVTAGAIALGGSAAAFTNITTIDGSNQPAATAPATTGSPTATPSPSAPVVTPAPAPTTEAPAPAAPTTVAPAPSAPATSAPAPTAPTAGDEDMPGDDAAERADSAPAGLTTPAPSAPATEEPKPAPAPSGPVAAIAPARDHDDAETTGSPEQRHSQYEGRRGQESGGHYEGHGQHDG